MNKVVSELFYQKALHYFPGGVNSPVRAFKSVGGTPIFFEKGNGSRITDVDGNEYIDFCGSWGPLILGHNHPSVKKRVLEAVENGLSFGAPTKAENNLAGLIIDNNRFIEKIRFVNSGTEAVMSAIRLARGYTGKDKIIKFEGCYHGHVDSLLVKAGSGLVTFGETSSAGVPDSFSKETIVLPLNNREALDEAIDVFSEEVAAVIIEPVPANNGLLLQDQDFLQYLREKTEENGILLIFDEVISGFRLQFEGAAGFYDIQPDLITYGKIIGGGMPVGAYGGKAEIMKMIAPDGPVYQAGTLSGNPVAMSAGYGQVKECLEPGFYDNLNGKTEQFVNAVSDIIIAHNYPVRMFNIGSIFWLSFSNEDRIAAADEINAENMGSFATFHAHALEEGLYFGPSGYEVGFVSSAHTTEDLDLAAEGIGRALKQTFG